MPKGVYKSRVRPTPKCGTVSGHTTHRKNNETPCEECHLANSLYKKQYRETNKVYIKDYLQDYRDAHKDIAKSYAYNWGKNNKDKKNGYERKRRAARYLVEHSPYSSDEVIALYGSNCHICLESIDLSAPRQSGRSGWENGLHLDHLIPLNSGGADTIVNIRPAHGLCNVSKGHSIKENEK
jgi:5-methylcytosine-specific restriction endonuclease McrA